MQGKLFKQICIIARPLSSSTHGGVAATFFFSPLRVLGFVAQVGCPIPLKRSLGEALDPDNMANIGWIRVRVVGVELSKEGWICLCLCVCAFARSKKQVYSRLDQLMCVVSDSLPRNPTDFIMDLITPGMKGARENEFVRRAPQTSVGSRIQSVGRLLKDESREQSFFRGTSRQREDLSSKKKWPSISTRTKRRSSGHGPHPPRC